MAADITIVGLGTVQVDHVTRQGARVLSEAKQVLFLDDGVATRAFLEDRCPIVVDLKEHLVDGRSRVESHHHIAAAVLAAALDDGPVCLAVAGHPTHLVPATFLIRDLATLVGLTVEVLPGISAMDQLFVELMIDPASHGLQCFEATDLLLRRRPLAADVPLLVWQIGLVGTLLPVLGHRPPEAFEPLTRHLLRFYPPDHEVILAEAASHALLEPAHVAVRLAVLPGHAAVISARTTLYVPPIGTRPISDQEVLDGLSPSK